MSAERELLAAEYARDGLNGSAEAINDGPSKYFSGDVLRALRAIATARAQGRQEATDEIVAWLRGMAHDRDRLLRTEDGWNGTTWDDGIGELNRAADAIANGDHLGGGG